MQKERIAHKEDVIKLKDEAIAAETNSPRRQPAPLIRAPSHGTNPDDPRIGNINDTVRRDIENKLQEAITNKRFKFVFNPLSERSKILSFLPDGRVGDGKNDNETRWRIANGRLEIINSAGDTYSRFFLFPDGKSLHHTNEKELASIHGQFMIPI